jgi:amino-acid N-acetyltransferase
MLRKAEINDIKNIQLLINEFADKGKMLHRSLNSLFDNLRDFVVCYDENNKISGCGALHIAWYDLAEIKSLAVDKENRYKGIGKKIINYLLDEARVLKVKKVFALTYETEFFIKLGFNKIDKSELPHKVWSDCINCSKFPDCDEVAVSIDL